AEEFFSHILQSDSALKYANTDYEAKRHKDIALRLPLVKKLPVNSFSKWLSSKGKLGGQHKVPRLSNDRKILDDIVEFIKSLPKRFE
ncbi:MAG: GH3 auxin-responsive promoter family protein, partial [Bacteroidota bacterium]